LGLIHALPIGTFLPSPLALVRCLAIPPTRLPTDGQPRPSIGFGGGAALTLDEFALWLNLEDDYWTKQGRESIDAVALFGALLALSVLGKGFAKDAAKLPAARSAAPA
jgi:hypothetical protein